MFRSTVVSPRQFKATRGRALVAIALACGIGPALDLSASVVTATSEGVGLQVDLTALSALHLQAGPLPAGASGAAPIAYARSTSAANVNVAASVPVVATGGITAALVSASAASTVDGLAGTKTTTASSGVTGAGVNISTLPVVGTGLPVLGLNATLTSNASIAGDFGALTASGTTTITSLNLAVGGVTVPLNAYVGVALAPNTTVDLSALGLAGVSLILNEQVVAADKSSITVNALDLKLNVAGALGVQGNVVLGHSFASQAVTANAVPEPTTALVGGLFGVLGLRRTNRRRKGSAAASGPLHSRGPATTRPRGTPVRAPGDGSQRDDAESPWRS